MGKLQKLPNKLVRVSRRLATAEFPSTINGIRFLHWLALSQKSQIQTVKDTISNNSKNPYLILSLNDFKRFFEIKSKDNKKIWRAIYDVTGIRLASEVSGAVKYSPLFGELLIPYCMKNDTELELDKNNKSFIKNYCFKNGKRYDSTSFLLKLNPVNEFINEFLDPKVYTQVSKEAYLKLTSCNQMQMYLICSARANMRGKLSLEYFELIDLFSSGFRKASKDERDKLVMEYKSKPYSFKDKVLRKLIKAVNEETELEVSMEEKRHHCEITVGRPLVIDIKQEDLVKKYGGSLSKLKVNFKGLYSGLDELSKIFLDKVLTQTINAVKSKMEFKGDKIYHKHNEELIRSPGVYFRTSIINECPKVLDEIAINYKYEEFASESEVYFNVKTKDNPIKHDEFYELKNSFFNQIKIKSQYPREFMVKLIEEVKHRTVQDND